jgi:hypothetical protein
MQEAIAREARTAAFFTFVNLVKDIKSLASNLLVVIFRKVTVGMETFAHSVMLSARASCQKDLQV